MSNLPVFEESAEDVSTHDVQDIVTNEEETNKPAKEMHEKKDL